MKLFASVFLVLVILEEYHCDPCLEWLFVPPNTRVRPNYQPGYTYYSFPSYGTNQLSYQPWNVPNPAVYYPYYGRPIAATYNIPLGGGAAQNGVQYGTSDGMQGGFNRPQNPTPFGGTAPHGSPNVQTPVETEDGTPSRRRLFVTPDGIRETPAEPLDNAS